MKKILTIFSLACASTVATAQTFFIDKTDSDYFINTKELSAKSKKCLIFNCINIASKSSSHNLRPLIVIKLFDYENRTPQFLSELPSKCLSLKDYMKTIAIPKLQADMTLQIETLESLFHGSSLNRFDSLILFDGKRYQLLPGVVLTEFFSLVDFPQLSILQTNQTALNVGATIAPIHAWVSDSLPIPRVNAIIGGKLFLLKKNGNDYTFFRHPFDCSDCPLTFYNEYVFRKNYGIIAFKSKCLQYNLDSKYRKLFGEIIESDEYYYYK